MKKIFLVIQKEEYRFIISINPFLELEQEKFEKRYSEIVDYFGTNKFLLKINNEIIGKYKKYEQGLITLNDREYKIYDLVYK